MRNLWVSHAGSLIHQTLAPSHPTGARDPAEWARVDRESTVLRFILIVVITALAVASIVFGVMMIQ